MGLLKREAVGRLRSVHSTSTAAGRCQVPFLIKKNDVLFVILTQSVEEFWVHLNERCPLENYSDVTSNNIAFNAIYRSFN